jgi:hypothetical protein
MFWNNQLFWYGFAVIVILTFICLAIAIYIRKKRLENKFIVGIQNGGNVPSSFLLRLENQNGSFEYHFSQNGRGLPLEVFTSRQNSSQTNAKGSSNAQNLVFQAQSTSSTMTQHAPSQLSAPIIDANATIAEGQRELGVFQYYLKKLGLAGASSRPAGSQSNHSSPSSAAQSSQSDKWAATGEVQPGSSLRIELSVSKKQAGALREWPFQLVSRAKADEKAPDNIQEGLGRVDGKFWSDPILPALFIVGAAILLVVGLAIFISM